MNVAVTSIVKRAFRRCGQSGAPGRGISAEMQVEGIDILNELYDQWNARSIGVYTERIQAFPLVNGTQSYTIGPGGNFNTDRPARIDKANILLTTGSTTVRVPPGLTLLDDEEYGSIPVLNVGGIPTRLYYDGDYKQTAPVGVGNLIFYPFPNQGNLQVELFDWTPYNNALTSADTVQVPDGVLMATTLSLAEQLAPMYWKRTAALLANLKTEAANARSIAFGLNTRAGHLKTDVPRMPGKGRAYFNYLTGGRA